MGFTTTNTNNILATKVRTSPSRRHAVHDEDDGVGLFDSDYNSHTASSDEDRVIITEHLRSKLNEAYKEIRRHEHSQASTHGSGSNKPMSPQRQRAAAGSSSSVHKHHHHHHGQGQDQQLLQGDGSDPNDDATMKTSDIHMRTPHTQGEEHGH
jgi:hypothetical protein